MKLLKSLLLSTLTAVSFSACSNVEKQKEGIQVIDYRNPKKVCFGRIEVTVPKETEVEYSNFNYNGSDIEFDEKIKGYDDYVKLIADKIQYLKHEPHETEGVLLKQEISGTVQQAGRSISHIIVYRDGKYVTSLYEVYGYLYFPQKGLLVLKSGASNDLLDEAIDDMKNTLKSIKIRSTKGEEQAGLCWKDFFIADDMSKNIPFGGGYLHFKFPSYPGMRIDINHRVTYESDQPLIAMMKKNQQDLPEIAKIKLGVKNLREQQKVIHGLAGEEVLNHIYERGLAERGFEDGAWQYLGTLDNHNDPFIHYSLESAEMTNPNESFYSNISQKNVIQLHDFILKSLQVSPNNKKEK
ncbi:T6SS immunity protein Tli4 family protein [Acinetobacter sp. 'aerobic (ED)']|uniref:T6SS immunity protein Tli4 family protein n=1 Tax=Acinetobacter sp. 'aerobic (ED)' TaxID=174230 RepID=UPI000451BF40|nr:T6SS immunity protein Tli4 family protein [Acinetobacter sp. 'aerobic (ED)']EXB26931.1 hypothetical protein J537_1501 [Acinetobacter baumannii 1437282]